MIRRLIVHDVVEGISLDTLTFVDRASIDALDERHHRALDPKVRLTTAEVAARADVHPSTVNHHVKRGSLPAIQLTPNGKYWFLPEEVGPWLQSRQP